MTDPVAQRRGRIVSPDNYERRREVRRENAERRMQKAERRVVMGVGWQVLGVGCVA